MNTKATKTITKEKPLENPLDSIINKHKIIEDAVDVLLWSEDECDDIRFEAKSDIAKEKASLIGSLAKVIRIYPGSISEDEWDKSYSSVVRKRLAASTKSGTDEPRYKNDNTISVMLNNFKVAAIAMSFSKTNESLAPAPSDTNLTKYVSRVRPILQSIKDPYTGKRLLKQQDKTPKAPKVLDGDQYYWLVGFETEDGLRGANTVIAGSHKLSDLEVKAAEFKTKFKAFSYLTSKAVNLSPADKVTPVTPNFVNAAVQAATVSSVQDA